MKKQENVSVGRSDWKTDTIPYVNSIFEQPWWLDAVTDGNWQEIVLRNNDEIVARLPYAISGKKIYMPQQTQTVGPWFQPINEDSGLKIYKERLCKLINNIPVTTDVELGVHRNNRFFLPWRWNGFTITPSISYVIEDLRDLDAVFSKMAKNVKRDIKKANKILHVEETVDIDILYDMLNKSYSKQGRRTTSDYRILKNVVEAACLHNACKMFTAYDKDKNCCASALFVYDSNTCYYLKGGADYKFSNTNAASLLIWKGICFAATVSKEFDFEGSSVEGISDFFSRFGGRPAEFFIVRKKTLFKEIGLVIKPKIKRLIGYKI